MRVLLCWTRNCSYCLKMVSRQAPLSGLRKKKVLALIRKLNYTITFALVTIIFQLIKTQKHHPCAAHTHITIWFNSITYQSPDQLLFFPLISLMTKPIKNPGENRSSCLAHPINCIKSLKHVQRQRHSSKAAPDSHKNILTIMMLLSKAY